MLPARSITLCLLLFAAALALRAQSWTRTSAPTNSVWYSIAVPPAEGTMAAAANGGGIYTSTNAGATWAQTTAPSTAWYSIAGSSNGSVLAAAIWSSTGRIYTSTNAGETWKQTAAPARYWDSVVVSHDGRKLAAAANSDGIYTSTNTGQTWQKTSAPALGWFTLATSSDGSKLAALVYGGGIYTSTNSGKTWVKSAAPDAYWGALACSADGSRLTAGVYATGGIYISTNSGASWTLTDAPTTNWLSLSSSETGKTLLASVNGGDVYLSTNYGVNWKTASAPVANWYSVATTLHGSRFFGATHSDGIYTDAMPITQHETIGENTPASFELNRGQLDGTQFTFTLVTPPTNGVLDITDATSGAATYTPNANYRGPDAFTYTVLDGSLCVTGYAAVTITAVNNPPVASDDQFTTAEDTMLTVTPAGVLANDADADGDALTAVLETGPLRGTLALSTNGGFTYTPTNYYSSADTFTYRANDGTTDSEIATVTIQVTPPLVWLKLEPLAGTNALQFSSTNAAATNAGFVLQQSTDLNTTNWEDIGNLPLTVPRTDTNTFFRLKR